LKKLTVFSFYLTLGVSSLLLLGPTCVRTERSTVPGEVSITNPSMLQVNAPRIIFVLSVPVFVALMPMLVPIRGVRIASAVVLATFALATLFSFGPIYMPSAATMIAATLRKT
jgi:hypothetical protein